MSGIGGFALGQDPALVTAGQGLIAPLISAGGGALVAALIIRRQRRTTAPSPETQLPIAAHAPATIPPPAGVTPQQQEMMEAIARVVHDIRTPMVALSTIAELLATGQTYTEDTRARLARHIQSEAVILEQTVDQLTDVLRTQSGRATVHCEDLDMPDLIEEAAISFRVAETHALVLESGSDLGALHGDRVMIIRGIRNLLSNAHKYAPAGTTIYLRCTRTSPESLDIEVSDSGPGIARTDADRVFEPSTRGTVYTDNEGVPPGAGMGLAIVRLVAQMHRGDVTITNHAQGGAIFTLTLRDAIGCLHRTGAPLLT